MKSKFFLIAIILVAVESCTIHKRHYLPGYHVEWNNRQKEANSMLLSAASEEHTQSLTTEESIPALKFSEAPCANQNENDEANAKREGTHTHARTFGTPNAQSALHPRRPRRFFDGVVSNAHISHSHSNPEEGKEVETAAVLSFVFAVLFFAMPFISSLWAIIGLIFPILAIIQGAIGMYRIKHDPNLKGKGLAIAGFILGIIGLLMIAFLFLLVTFAFPL